MATPRRMVLVVDPNPNTRERVASAMGGADFDIAEAKDVDEALSRAETSNVVLVLACASLPRGNGYDLASRIRTRHPKCVVFLLSGGFEAYDANRAQAAGVVGRIPKPFSPDTLLFHINAAVGSLQNLGEEQLTEVGGEMLAPMDQIQLDPLPPPLPSNKVPPRAEKQNPAEKQNRAEKQNPAEQQIQAEEPKPDPEADSEDGPGARGSAAVKARLEKEGEPELPVFDGSLVPVAEEAEVAERPIVRERKKPVRRPVGVPDTHYRPPSANERVATFLPRDYEDLPRVSVDPAVVGPAIEQAILEVLPEVVEIVLRRALATSEPFREMVDAAVEEAVRRELPAALARAKRKADGAS